MTTKQCKNCPWLKGATSAAIPRYSREKHEGLRATIAEPGSLAGIGRRGLRVMACHHSRDGAETPCAGWLHHQIGVGNNLPLRFAAMFDPRLRPEIIGPQRADLQATLDENDDDAEVES